MSTTRTHLREIQRRIDWLNKKIEGKTEANMTKHFEERERDALEWAVSQLSDPLRPSALLRQLYDDLVKRQQWKDVPGWLQRQVDFFLNRPVQKIEVKD